MKKNLLLPVVIVLLGTISCTVQKRIYRDGYHVEWHLMKKKPSTAHHDEKNDMIISAHENTNEALNPQMSQMNIETNAITSHNISSANDQSGSINHYFKPSKNEATKQNHNQLSTDKQPSIDKTQIKNIKKDLKNLIKEYKQSYGRGGSDTLAILSLVFGVISLLFICLLPYLSIILGIAAVVMGIIAMNNGQNKTMALIGIISGAIGALFWLLLLIGLVGTLALI